MSTNKATSKIETQLARQQWTPARRQIEKELVARPDDHWLLTQLGVTYYEQRNYRQALKPLVAALKIMPDCPLALWNLAGTLDALKKPALAMPIYTWLLCSKKTPEDDPCWESDDWTDSLKTDCIYRLGFCFQHIGENASAEHCFRQYVQLLLAGMNGSYPIEEAAAQIRQLHKNGKGPLGDAGQNFFTMTLRELGIKTASPRKANLPQLNLDEVLAGS